MAGFDIPDNDVAFNANQSIWFSTDIDILAAGLAGVGVVSGCGVTAQGSPDMTVAIAAGTIRIASGAAVAVTSGNGTITTADATNPRIDLVSASNAGTKTVTAGTAAANPKPPDLPSGHIALAMVYVPATDTTIATNQITDKRVILPSFSYGVGTAFPASPATSDLFFRTDRALLYYYDGTRWLTVQEYTARVVITDAFMATTTPPNTTAPTDEGDNGAWVTRWVAWSYNIGSPMSSHYLTWQLRSGTAAAVYHNIGSTFATNGDTSAQLTKHVVTIGAAVTAGDTNFKPLGTKSGSPTGIYLDSTVFYRLIG